MGDIDTKMRFHLIQYNFIVLFWLSPALNVSMERSSGVSGHKIRSMNSSQIDLKKSKWIWKNGADAIINIRRSLLENMKRVGLYQPEDQGEDGRIIIKCSLL